MELSTSALAKVEADIAKVEAQIEAVELEVLDAKQEDDREELAALRNKAQLRTEKAQLRTEKAQLRTEKAQLRTDKGERAADLAENDKRFRALELSHRVPFSPTSVAETYRSLGPTVVQKTREPRWWTPAADSAWTEAARALPLLPHGSLESEVQQAMEKYFATLRLDAPHSVVVGRSTQPSIGGTRKPDFVGFRAVRRATHAGLPPRPGTPSFQPVSHEECHINFLGEAKHRRQSEREGIFTELEKGHTLSFAAALAEAQPWRASQAVSYGPQLLQARMITFLTDGLLVVFFECVFELTLRNGAFGATLVSLGESDPLPVYGVGGAFLAGLCLAEQQQLGAALPLCPDGSPVSAFLGMGATSAGYACLIDGAPAVAKVLQCRADHPWILKEVDALLALQQLPGVVKLLSQTANTLFLSPLGATSFSLDAPPPAQLAQPGSIHVWRPDEQPAPLQSPRLCARPTAAHFCALVDVLALVHAKGFVHRDPRPANWFLSSQGSFVLADLGSALRVGTVNAWDDARPFGFNYGPEAVLRSMAEQEDLPPAAPAHDMEQVARLFYAAQTRDGAFLPTSGSAVELLEWWSLRDRLEGLAGLLSLARRASDGEDERTAFKAALCRGML
jgi:hypothetical protein